MTFLISGTKSGLGKYLHDNLGGLSLTRQTTSEEKERIKKNGVDVIIHCAFNSDRDPKNSDQYIQDNVQLTEELTKLPHKKFIFISSVDVYPENSSKHVEDEIVEASEEKELYPKTKILSEKLVTKNCPNFLILRCSALLGKDSRENSLIKIIKQTHPILTLSAKSLFNYVLHKDVLAFINLAIKKNLQGIYNFASTENITLKEAAEMFNKEVKFGDYIYNVGTIDTKKIITVFPPIKKTSKKIIAEFVGVI